MERTKAFDDREWLERAISTTCTEIPDITTEMFVEAKVVQLGQIVANLKKENGSCRHTQYQVRHLNK